MYTIQTSPGLYVSVDVMHGEECRLVQRAREGDRDAFETLVTIHWSRLVRLARSVAGEAAAEDAVQEGLLACWRKLPRLKSPESFKPWVTRTVFRQCLRMNRRRDLHHPGAAPPARERGTRVEAAVLAEQILAALAPRQRAVMHLTLVEGHTDSEIAVLLGITAGSVRSHRRRARSRIDSSFGIGEHEAKSEEGDTGVVRARPARMGS